MCFSPKAGMFRFVLRNKLCAELMNLYLDNHFVDIKKIFLNER
ncbi:MAG: hypothetical protein H6Q20_1422 [Bacteroidetes bacterium]|nr:hypothetical protein [Bacteroidota bacterium]